MIALRCIAPDGDYVTEGKDFESVEAAWQRSHDMGSRWFFYPIHVVTGKRRIKSLPDGIRKSWENCWLDTLIAAMKWELANNEAHYMAWVQGNAPCPLEDPWTYKGRSVTATPHPTLPGIEEKGHRVRTQEWTDATWLNEVRDFLRLIARHSTYGEGEGELHPGQNDNLEDCARVMNHHILKARGLMENLLPPITHLPSTCRLALQLGSSVSIVRFAADILEHGNFHALTEQLARIEDRLRMGASLHEIPHAPWHCPDCREPLVIADDSGECKGCGKIHPIWKLRVERDKI